MVVRRFNATLSAKGYVWFWPKIAAALVSKHHWLVIACDRCDTVVGVKGHNRTKCGAAKASIGISSSGSARDNQHLSYPWIVSPRSSMATNSAILRALVSAFLTLPIRYRIA